MAVNIDRASNGTVTFDFGVGIDPIVLTDSNNIIVSSEETKNSVGTIIRQDISFMRETPYFFYALTWSQIGTINGAAKPAIGAATTTLLETAVFQGTISDEVTQDELAAEMAKVVLLTTGQTIAGIKTFTDNPTIKGLVPGITFKSSADANLGYINFGDGAPNVPSFISTVVSEQLRLTVGNAAAGTLTLGTAGQIGLGNPVAFGTNGQVLTSGGAAGSPSWTSSLTVNSIAASGMITSSSGLAGNTTVTAGIGSNSVQMDGAPNGSDTVIRALGVTDANVSIQFQAKGTGLLKLASPTNVTGAFNATGSATFGGNVTVAGQLGSANNTSLPSATNSGVTIGGAPTWAMASFYDQAVSANNRTADLLFISNSFKLRFANDARSAFLDVLSINGGQGTGVTSVTSTSGSGAWIHTGGLEVQSTTQGFLPPKMTTAEKDAIASPAEGLVVYDTTLRKLCVNETGVAITGWKTVTTA